MLSIRARCFLVLLLFSVMGFGPVSVTALIGIVIVLTRPAWFLRVVHDVYRGTRNTQNPPEWATPSKPNAAVGPRLRCLLALTGLLILDIAPVPVVGGIGLWTLTFRPTWFLRLVNRIYGLTEH